MFEGGVMYFVRGTLAEVYGGANMGTATLEPASNITEYIYDYTTCFKGMNKEDWNATFTFTPNYQTTGIQVANILFDNSKSFHAEE